MRRGLWALVIAIPLVVLLAIGLRHDPNATVSTLVGRPAPAFALRSSDGRLVTLKSLGHRAVVVNFWATWCPSCLEEHRNLVRLWRKYATRGIAFVGITFRDSVGNARDFERKHGGNWPVLADPNIATAINYGVLEPPETFLIDSHGVVRYKAVGAVATGGAISEMAFDRKLQSLLAPDDPVRGAA